MTCRVATRLLIRELDEGGPRLVTPAGSTALHPPASGHGVAAMPGGGLVVSTWGDKVNYLVAYDLS